MSQANDLHEGNYSYGEDSARKLRDTWGSWIDHGINERSEKIGKLSNELNSSNIKDEQKSKKQKEINTLKEELKSIQNSKDSGYFKDDYSVEDWEDLDTFSRTKGYKETIQGDGKDENKDPVKRIQAAVEKMRNGSIKDFRKDRAKREEADEYDQNGLEFENAEDAIKDPSLTRDEDGNIDYIKSNKENFRAGNRKDEEEKGNTIKSGAKASYKGGKKFPTGSGETPLILPSSLIKQIKNSGIKSDNNNQVNKAAKPIEDKNGSKHSHTNPEKPTQKKEDEKREGEERKPTQLKKSINEKLKDLWKKSSTIRKWIVRINIILLLLAIFFQLIYGFVVVLTAYCDDDGSIWAKMKDEMSIAKDTSVTDILVGVTDFDNVKMLGFSEEQTAELTDKGAENLSNADEWEFAKMALNIVIRSTFLDGNGSSDAFVQAFNQQNKTNLENKIKELESKKERTEEEENQLIAARKALDGTPGTSINFLDDPLTVSISIFVDAIRVGLFIWDAISTISLVASFIPGLNVAAAPISLLTKALSKAGREALMEGAKAAFKAFMKQSFKQTLKLILKEIGKNWKSLLFKLTKNALLALGIARSIGHFLGKWLLSIDFIKDTLKGFGTFILKKIGGDLMVNWGLDNPQLKGFLDAVCKIAKPANGCGDGFVSSGKTFEAGGFTVEAPEFIPNNQNLFYALIGITGKESGGKLSAAGDRDSVGPYQQRVNEYMNGQGEMGTVAKQVLGSKFDEIFTSENKDFISSQNAAAGNGANIVEYGPKMREIAQKLIDAGGRKLFDQIQLARFKSRGVYDTIVNYNLNNDNVPDFAQMVFKSHGVGATAGWVETFTKIVQDGLAKNIYSQLSNGGSDPTNPSAGGCSSGPANSAMWDDTYVQSMLDKPVPNAYGCQCVAWARKYGLDVWKTDIGGGNAADYAGRTTDKIGWVENNGTNKAPAGSIVVWSGNTYGHIALIKTWTSADEFVSIDQNWGDGDSGDCGNATRRIREIKHTKAGDANSGLTVVGWMILK